MCISMITRAIILKLGNSELKGGEGKGEGVTCNPIHVNMQYVYKCSWLMETVGKLGIVGYLASVVAFLQLI